MAITRKEFFKSACLSGACLCGFGSVAMAATSTPQPDPPADEIQNKLLLVQQYLGALLLKMGENLDEKQNRSLLKELARIHYEHLNMDQVMEPYVNNIEGFIEFLTKEWNWKISYNKETKILLANENKNYCVCPMINLKTGIKPTAICYCSEGFAELMFSKVTGKPVSARVVSSIHRGGEQCMYEIKILG